MNETQSRDGKMVDFICYFTLGLSVLAVVVGVYYG